MPLEYVRVVLFREGMDDIKKTTATTTAAATADGVCLLERRSLTLSPDGLPLHHF